MNDFKRNDFINKKYKPDKDITSNNDGDNAMLNIEEAH